MCVCVCVCVCVRVSVRVVRASVCLLGFLCEVARVYLCVCVFESVCVFDFVSVYLWECLCA